MLTTRLDNIEKMIKKPNTPLIRQQICSDVKFPISSVEQLNLFEIKLQTQEFYNDTMIHLQSVNGSGQYWRSACYKLCDYIFEK